MSDLVVPVAVLGVLAMVGLLVFLAVLVLRRTLLSRGVGAFDCSLRRRTEGRGWVFGVARYQDDRLEWFRLFDISWRPSRSLSRSRLTILDRRRPDSPDTSVLSPDWVLVRCVYDSATLELGMSETAYTGLSTWLESAPPGEHPLLT